MCFSATASFTAGAVLAVAGIVSQRYVQHPTQRLFAFIPLFFAIQQVCEGFVWLSLSEPGVEGWHEPAKYAFLTFAQVIWPFYIPLAFMLMEREPTRKKIMKYLFFGGIAGSLILTYRLIFYTATADIEGCHVDYSIAKPEIMMAVSGLFYLGAIVIAPFFSSWKYTKLLASVNVVSLVVTEVFFEVYFVSVWCFFAAVQSLIVVLCLRHMRDSRLEI